MKPKTGKRRVKVHFVKVPSHGELKKALGREPTTEEQRAFNWWLISDDEGYIQEALEKYAAEYAEAVKEEEKTEKEQKKGERKEEPKGREEDRQKEPTEGEPGKQQEEEDLEKQEGKWEKYQEAMAKIDERIARPKLEK